MKDYSTRIIKALLFIGVLLMLSQAKAQNPYLSLVKWDVKKVQVSNLGEYELTFTCRTKNRDFGIKISSLSLNDFQCMQWGIAKWENEYYQFKVRTSLPPKQNKFALIIRDMYMMCEYN